MADKDYKLHDLPRLNLWERIVLGSSNTPFAAWRFTASWVMQRKSNIYRMGLSTVRYTKKRFAVMPRKVSGFTLIELLVVISIIGLLASVVLSSLNTARAKARDAKLLAEMSTLQTVMELYYHDNGRYPPNVTDPVNAGVPAWMWWSWPMSTSLKGDATDPTLKNALNPYLKTLPDTPSVSVSSYKGARPLSRISYTTPHNNWAQFGEKCITDLRLGSTNCYALIITTETETSIGPGGSPIYIFGGAVSFKAYGGTGGGQWWGLW